MLTEELAVLTPDLALLSGNSGYRARPPLNKNRLLPFTPGLPRGSSALLFVHYSADDALPSCPVPRGVSGQRSNVKGQSLPSKQK